MQYVEVASDLHAHHLVCPAGGAGLHLIVVLARVAVRGHVPPDRSTAEALAPSAGFPAVWCREALMALVASRAIMGSEAAGWVIHPELWAEFGRGLLKKQERDRERYARLRAARAVATHTAEEWRRILREVDGCCVRCGSTDWTLEKDHIVPLYLGGDDGIENLQPLCWWCNASKGAERINWLAVWRSGRVAVASEIA